MNRIILIGNGFDLAHEMPTGYNDFLKNCDSKSTSENNFLKIITEKSYLQNWVDIENEYYLLLKNSFNNSDSANNYTISELNTDFEKVKDFTGESINQQIEDEYNKISRDIKDIEEGIVNVDEFSTKHQSLIRRLNANNKSEEEIKQEIRKILISEDVADYFQLIPKQTLLLNFNYTHNDLPYKNQNYYGNYNSEQNTKTKFIHIHGSLSEKYNNPIIFGFGDEIDESYRSIEKLNDNRYLENIKSIKYLETANYKKLLEFINSSNYQIFIFGHSCGISDRTLLSTLFEHKNCVSIKPFYYKNKQEDNYSDIVMNISRNFSNKAEMRNKVVNKEYCEALT